MNKADAERFHRIQRETGMGYGITLKDLAWLVRLVEKLAAAQPESGGPDISTSLLMAGAESPNVTRKRRLISKRRSRKSSARATSGK